MFVLNNDHTLFNTCRNWALPAFKESLQSERNFGTASYEGKGTRQPDVKQLFFCFLRLYSLSFVSCFIPCRCFVSHPRVFLLEHGMVYLKTTNHSRNSPYPNSPLPSQIILESC